MTGALNYEAIGRAGNRVAALRKGCLGLQSLRQHPQTGFLVHSET
jgi:hypothetical protein